MIVLEIDGNLPSNSELNRAIARNATVTVYGLPEGSRSIDFLRPIIDRVEELSIADPRCTDLSVLSDATHLVDLDIEDARPTVPLDFSRCPLETLSIFGHDSVQSAIELRTLKWLRIRHPTAAKGESFLNKSEARKVLNSVEKR